MTARTRVWLWLGPALGGAARCDRQIDVLASRPHDVVLSRSVGALLATGKVHRRASATTELPAFITTGFSRPMVQSHTISQILVN